MRSENNKIANFFANAVSAILLLKKATQSLGAHIGFDITMEKSLASRL